MRPVFDPSAVHHLKHRGAVDADGHLLEDAALWQHYIEAKHKDRALCIKRDENGLEYLEIGGRPSKRTRRGYPATLGRMGQKDLEAFTPHPDHTGDYLQALEEMVDAVPAPARAGLLGGNVRTAFGF